MKSYFHQTRKTPYVFETIPERVKKLADEDPDKIAMVVYHSKEVRYQMTRKELFDKALRFAHVLIRLGVRKGDRVALSVSNISNSIDWMVYDLGIIMAGAISVRLHEAVVMVLLPGCSMVILDSKDLWNDFLSTTEIQEGGKVTCNKFSSLKLAMAVNAENRPTNALLASELMAEIDGIDYSQLPVLDPEETAVISHTLLGTDMPKKVPHSHFDIINNFTDYCNTLDITADDVSFMNQPLFYISGYPKTYIGVGATVVTGEPAFLNSPANDKIVVDIWKKEGCNNIFVRPRRLKSLSDYGFRVKLIISGGDVITKEMIQQSFVFGDAFALFYAREETMLTVLEIFTKENISKHQQGMLGFPLRGVEVKIVNEYEEVVERGTEGTLCIRSAWNTHSYDGNQVSPFTNGWFHTNDLCNMQPDGTLLRKGQKSSFINRGTFSVSTAMIEDYVGSHPDVQHVVVVGIPNPQSGEDICACVQIVPGREFDKDSLKSHSKEKMLSNMYMDGAKMSPTYFLSFDDFPRTWTGKVLRRETKNMAIQRLNEDGLILN